MKTGKNYRWRILSLLFFATTINYIDRQVIGLLKPTLDQAIGWSDAEYGYVVTAFQAAYAIGLVTSGWLLDKFGTRLGYFWAVCIWSLAGMFHAAVKTVSGFGIARFALGIGEAANFPAAVKAVAEWFPKKERAFAAGLFNSGSTVGAITAPLIVAALTLSFGWRSAFLVTGALGFIWVIFWLMYYKRPEDHPRLSKEELEFIQSDEPDGAGAGIKVRWINLLKHKQTLGICTTRFISDWVWWFFLFWIPDFLQKQHGVDLKEAVLPLIIIYAISSIGGIGGGWISSRFISTGKSVNYARKTTILICALLILPVMLVSQISNLWIAVMLISLAAAGHQGWASNIFTIVSDVYPKNSVASMMGLSGFAGAIGGALSASFVGLILEGTNSYFLIFSIASVVYLLNYIILRISIPKIEPIKRV